MMIIRRKIELMRITDLRATPKTPKIKEKYKQPLRGLLLKQFYMILKIPVKRSLKDSLRNLFAKDTEGQIRLSNFLDCSQHRKLLPEESTFGLTDIEDRESSPNHRQQLSARLW